MKHTVASLIGVAKVPLHPWLQLQLQPHCAADLRSTYNYNGRYTFELFMGTTITRVLQRSTMPGVPSGRGCDACRKQKKKVRPKSALYSRFEY